MADWCGAARNLVRAELAGRGIGYAELSERLKKLGVEETPKNLSNKIARGTFSTPFFLQILRALEVDALYIQWKVLLPSNSEIASQH